MLDDLFYFGNLIFLIYLWGLILQIVLSVIRFCLNGGKTKGNEYHRLYEESMEWMRQEKQEPNRR